MASSKHPEQGSLLVAAGDLLAHSFSISNSDTLWGVEILHEGTERLQKQEDSEHMWRTYG